jgi:hypothetical protein
MTKTCEQILPDGWTPHNGGPCPVDFDAVIIPYYRGPVDASLGVRRGISPAIKFAWHHDGQDDDIIGYRIHQPEGNSQ